MCSCTQNIKLFKTSYLLIIKEVSSFIQIYKIILRVRTHLMIIFNIFFNFYHNINLLTNFLK